MVATGLLGDTIMCLPAMAAGRALLPSAEIVGLVTPTTRALLALAGIHDRYLETSGSPFPLRPRGICERRDLQRRIAAERFDLAVVFLGDDSASLISRAGVPHRVLVAESALARLATACYSIGSPRTWGPAERLGAWRALGWEPPPVRVAISPPADAAAAIDRHLGTAGARPVVAVHPYGRTPDQWLPHNVLEPVIAKLRQDGCFTVLVGGRREREIDHSRCADLDLAGELSLAETAALFRRAACVVSTDSGPLHLAGIMSRPTVGLFRRSRPEHASRYDCVTAVVAPEVPGCSALCAWDRCRDIPCRQLAAIDPDAISSAALRLARVSIPAVDQP